MSGWKPVEQAYSLWLRAAREERGSAVGLGRALEVYLRKTYRLGPDDDLSALGVETQLTGRTIGRWEKGTAEKPQPQYPADRWSREALQAVVTELVPAPPVDMEWDSFYQVCEAFAADRLKRIERGAGNLESHAATERNNERHQFLAAWPAPAAEIDPLTLGLGSWAFEGELPPYVTRTADTVLAQRLGLPGVTTVTGAPKSGKSRSILEVLQRQYPDALTWWVNPSPTVLPLVVEAAKKAKGRERPDVVVLDDAGLIGTDPTAGLTAQRLHDLADACTDLIIVIHTETIASWEHQLTHRTTGFDTSGQGVSQELMNLLVHRVTYHSVLDDVETGPATRTYDTANDRVKSFDLTRLAETLAGVETLRKQATHILETPTSVEAALLEAAIYASIAFPAGATPEILQTLATAHHKRRQPNRPWRPDHFHDALDTLTTGITTGSPHSILITTDHTTYRLLDALTPELQHPERDILGILNEIVLPDDAREAALLDTGHWHHNRALAPEMAEAAWLAAADLGSGKAMVKLGFLAAQQHEGRGMRAWWHRAAEAGDADGMYYFGLLLKISGEPHKSYVWWEQAAELGQPEAMSKLGQRASHAGDDQPAEIWWKHAAERGSAEAMFELGLLASKMENRESAYEWWEQAAKKGEKTSLLLLGMRAEEEGDMKAAERYWLEAAVRGDVEAMHGLGRLAEQSGDDESARQWWTSAADAGNVQAMVALAILAAKAGNLEA